MQLTAKLIEILPLQTGTGRNGEWKRQEIIVETQDQYPKKICMGIWGDKIEEDRLKIGNLLKLDFDIQSRKYNEKWYTNLKVWRLEVVVSEQQGEKQEATPPIEEPENFDREEDDDLPF